MSFADEHGLKDDSDNTPEEEIVTATATQPVTQSIDVPGARLTYDVRQNDATTEPPLVLIGSPMGAAGFASLAARFADRTIITYDPRGVERSSLTGSAGE